MHKADVEAEVERFLKAMTLSEKIGQLNQINYTAANAAQMKVLARQGKLGSVLLADDAFAGNGRQEKNELAFLNELQEAAKESRMGIPLIIGRDVIHGHRVVLPVPLAMAAAFHPELVKTCCRKIAQEAANDGIHWAFSPMLDVCRDPRWGRCIESPGEDPYLGECMARAVVEGFQGEELSRRESLAACAKHYVGYGASEGGRDYHKTEISDYTLRNIYLRAFKAAVDSGAATVMSSFNEISGQPVTSSHYLLTEVLKEEFGFDGFVVSDWEAIIQLIGQGVAKDREECAELAVNAGLDMDMVGGCYIEYLENLVKKGRVTEETIDEACRRILRIKLRCGIFENPYFEKRPIDWEDHLAAAEELAAESMVLLKNQDQILPLDKRKKIAVVGPMAKQTRALLGSWTLDYDESLVISIKDAVDAMLPEGSCIAAKHSLADEDVMAARQADVVIAALGESEKVTGECHSLTRIEVPKAQAELVKRLFHMGKKVIAVMNFGRPAALEEIEPYCAAILYAWHGGTMAAPAIAKLLFGKINPSGKLPMTMPRCTGQIPLYYNCPSSGRTWINGYYNADAYSSYEDSLGSPLYPFGYGLSYTEFSYGRPWAQEGISLKELEEGGSVAVTVTIENTGKYPGKETVQCYIRDTVSSMSRPMRELKAFEKIFLAPGEKRVVEFQLGKEALGYYNREGCFVVEPGMFEIYIGSDCYAKERITVIVEA